MKTKNFILGVALLLFVSCEKKLNIVPSFTAVESVALSTTESIDAGISYAYSLVHNNIGLSYTLWSELMADHIFYKGTLNNYLNYYNRNLNAAAEEQASSTDLRGVNNIKQREMYSAANTASLILRATQNDVAKSDPTFAPNKDRILGECYFLRAVSNFEILRLFSKPWGATEDNAHPGIIINKEPVDDRESQVKARSTVAEVYAFILEDLVKAEQLLPDDYNIMIHPAAYNGRAYRDAARGYLVKVYFQQHNYVKAKEFVDKLIGATPGNIVNHPLDADITQPFLSRGPDGINPENIYQSTTPLTTNGLSGFWWNSNTTLYQQKGATTANGVASAAFLQDARFSSQDQRRVLLFGTLATGELMPQKYSLTSQFSLPLIRSAEMVLDRAEINAMANNLQDAIKDVNVTRLRAQIAPLPATIAQAPLLDSIRTERIRELCFEGDRLWNLKRLKLPIPPGNRTGTAPLPWNGLETVLKYFPPELDRNPLLVNNY